MISRKLRNILIGILIAISTIGIGSVIHKNNQNKEPKSVYSQQYIINEDKKVLEADTIVDSLTEINTMNVLSYNGSKEIKIESGSFLSKRNQNIKFYFTADYQLDLSSITKDNVEINQATNTIKVFNKPLKLSEITFLEDKTEVSDVKKSEWYTLSNKQIELATSELEQLKARLKDKIKNDIENDTEALMMAESNASKNVNNTLRTLTGYDWDIEIIFVK